MKKRLITILCCFCLAAGVLSGCNLKPIEMNKIDPNADASEKIALSVLLPYVSDDLSGANPSEKLPVIDVIDEVTGYDVTYAQLPSGAAAETQLNNLMMDKGRDYHMLKLTKNQFNRYAVNAAAFCDITDVVNSARFSVIKNAILDGDIPNDYAAAFALMEQLAAERGLKKV